MVVNFFILVPSGAPEKISLHREGDSSMLLLWSPPRKDQRKGNIIAYQVNINAILIMTSFVRQMKTQINLGIRPVWSQFAVRMKKPWALSYPLSAQRRLWSESSLGTHSFCWFCHVVVHVYCQILQLDITERWPVLKNLRILDNMELSVVMIKVNGVE